ncbi:ComF family protein [Amycolatopsis sp. K13G38]|uniref:ComF family protein n=1 Tax=Amycolatopsis acididurans TaxID=2724524 RepID=A0ABX1JHJ9_9PSEU|nr:ComF family protein [Amycolatopsis acididurans]NKQ59280.1 ComF family protein [Amycolatopsis acididurans]
MCAGCGVPGAGCCAACTAEFARPSRVVRGPTADVAVYALGRYDGAARRLVLAFKERGRRDLAPSLGRVLAEALPYLPEVRPDRDGVLWLVPAPSRRSASRVRGGPHVLRLARACAARLVSAGNQVAIAPALRLTRGARDAVGLNHSQRAANLAGRVRLDPCGLPPPGTPVVLLDDVVTTGATAAACIQVLGDGGFPVSAVLALTATG